MSRSTGPPWSRRTPGCSARTRSPDCGAASARPWPTSRRTPRTAAGPRPGAARGRPRRRPRTTRWRRHGGTGPGLPRLIHLVGPSGSGKSRFARGIPGVDTVVGLDDLREDRGARADQRANGDVLRHALDRLDAALARGGTVVWDATFARPSAARGRARRGTPPGRAGHARGPAGRRDDRRAPQRRAGPRGAGGGAGRAGAPVLAAVPRRGASTWYIGADGTVDDTDGLSGGAED
ncbi:AAA family ATPase [Yinghuangia aomiensis]